MRTISKKINLSIAIIALALSTTACVKNTAWHGYKFDEENIAKIKPKLTTEQQVIELMGSPTLKSQYGQPTFFYMGNELESIAFLSPKVKNYRVLEIKFAHGKVQEIHNYQDSDLRNLKIISERVRIQGNEVGAVEQILGNVGRFSAPQSARR